MNEKGNDVFCVLCCPYSLNLVHDYQHLQSVTCPPLCSTNSIELCAPYLPHDDNVSGPVNSFMHVEFTSMEICSPISVFQGGLLYPEQSVRFMVYIPARTDKCRMTCRKLCYMPFGNVRVSGWLPFSCSDHVPIHNHSHLFILYFPQAPGDLQFHFAASTLMHCCNLPSG